VRFRSFLCTFATLFLLTNAVQSIGQTSIVFMQTADPQMGMFTANHGSQKEIVNLSEVVREANLLHPAFLVICGDLMNASQNPEQLQAFKTTITKLNGAPLHLVPGNHDVGNKPTAPQLALYRQRFGPDYYKFQSGPLIGIVLDSMLIADKAVPKETERQYQWLQKTLKKAAKQKNKQIAIFQHIPFFVKTADEPNSYWNIPLAERAVYLSLLHKYGVKHVFAGHLHHQAIGHDGDVEIVTAGATGMPIGKGSFSGFNLVQVNPHGPWHHQYFPLSDMPTHLDPPW
jgi:3',5'-cyclic AMP phosphodiesterase CpdA